MIHDIRVFNSKGELTNVINGQKAMDATYEQIASSVSKTTWGKSAKKPKVCVKCTVCQKEVLVRRKQATCGSNKCISIRRQLRERPESFRTFNCIECNIEVTTYHHNKKTCGADKCFKLNRDRGEKLRIQKLKEKRREFKETTE